MQRNKRSGKTVTVNERRKKGKRERERGRGALRYKKGDIFRVARKLPGNVDVHGPSHPSRAASTERRMVKERRFCDWKSFEARTNEARNRMRGKDYSVLGLEPPVVDVTR